MMPDTNTVAIGFWIYLTILIKSSNVLKISSFLGGERVEMYKFGKHK